MNLRTQLARSHFFIATIGAAVVLVALLLSLQFSLRASNMVDQLGPRYQSISQIQVGVNQTLAALRGWMSIGAPVFVEDWQSVWDQTLDPAIQALEQLEPDPHADEAFILLKPLLRQLKESQWWVIEVAQAPGNRPAEVFYEFNVEPLVDNFEQVTADILNTVFTRHSRELHEASFGLREHFINYLASIRELKEQEVSGAWQQTLLPLEQRLTGSIQTLRNFAIPELEKHLTLLEFEVDALLPLVREMISIHSSEDSNVARYLMQSETIPLAQDTTEVVNRLYTAARQEMTRHEQMTERYATITAVAMFLLLLATVAMAFYIAYRQAREISEPISQLSDAAKQISKGDLEHEIKVSGATEIASLSASFDKMRLNLAESRQRLFDANQFLEKSVQERTLELSLARQMLDQVNEAAYLADVDGQLRFVNGAATRMLGFSQKELLEKRVFDLDNDFSSEVAWSISWFKIKQAGAAVFESTHMHSDGNSIPVEVNATHITFNDEEFIFGLVRDLTERKRQERLLKLRADRDEALLMLPTYLEDMSEPDFMQRAQEITEDLTGSVISFIHFVNSDEQSIELVTWSKRTLEDYCDVVYETHYPVKEAGIWADALRQRKSVIFNDYENYAHKHGLPEGHAKLDRLISVPVIEGGKVVMLAGVGNKPFEYDEEDAETVQLLAEQTWRLVQRKRMLNQLENIAHYDALTGLPNRLLLGDRLDRTLARSRRSGKLVAVGYLDLDGFKEVNDSYGHSAGDYLLVELAGKMSACLRESDIIARLGGDEFVIVIDDLNDKSKAPPEFDRILKAVSEPITFGTTELIVSGSIGVTFFPQSGRMDSDTLMRQADHAMYQAKLWGRNRISYFDSELEEDIGSRNAIIERMWEGLAADEFVFHYQPKINLRSGELEGMELLIRWQADKDTLMPPAQFLNFAENDQIMVAFGKLAITTAIQKLAKWNDTNKNLSLSVNVDAYQLEQDDFVDWLRSQLERYPTVDPSRLALEILETSALRDMALASNVINACRAIGVRFSLDDFGTGYSSLTYLKSLPVAELKVDQSFVCQSLDDAGAIAIIEAVLGLSTAFQLGIVAEGVETEEHGKLLIKLGYEFGQGYAIAKPMPEAELDQWIESFELPVAWRGVRPLDRDELPLLFAQVEHKRWVKDLVEHTQQESFERPVIDSTTCGFGKWLKTAGQNRYGQNPIFHEVESIYSQLHSIADRLLDSASSEASDDDININLILSTSAQLIRATDELLEGTIH